MTKTNLFSPRLFSRIARSLVVLATGIALHAAAQEDPPGRVANINLQQGAVSMSPAGDDTWYDAIANRPLTAGDRLWTDRSAHAELFVGSIAVRMDEQTSVEFSELNDQTLRVTVLQGRVQLRARDDLAGQQVEVDTGNLAFVVRQPGDYRIRIDPQSDTTQVMVAQGSGTVYGDNGEAQEIGSREQAVFEGRNLAQGGAPAPMDAVFDRWLAERNMAEDQSQSARYVSREVVGYQQLDNYGQWQDDATYGAVWYPNNVDADWAPYSDGYWTNVAPWGWTWVDRAPWGFAPFHYGRWARVGPRWGWVPGRPQGRPVYSPALVGFVGGRPGTAGASFSVGSNRPAVGWFPLAPGETWRPGYHASDRYVDQANRMGLYNNQLGARNNAFANRNAPNGVTVVPADAFGRGQMGRRDYVHPPQPALAGTAVVNRPSVPWPTAGVTGPGGATAAFGFMGHRSSFAPPSIVQPRQQALQSAQPQQAPQFQQGQRIPAMQDQAARQQQMLREQQGLQRQPMQAPQSQPFPSPQQQQSFQQRAAREQQDFPQRGQDPWRARQQQMQQAQPDPMAQQQQRQQFVQQQQNQQLQQQQMQMQAQQQQAMRAQQDAAQARAAQFRQQDAQQQAQRMQLEAQQRAQQQQLDMQQRSAQAQQQQRAQMAQQQQLQAEQQMQRQQLAAQQQQQQQLAAQRAAQAQAQQQQAQQQALQAQQAHQARIAQQQQQQLQLQQQQQVQQQRILPRPPQGPGEPGSYRQQRQGGRQEQPNS